MKLEDFVSEVQNNFKGKSKSKDDSYYKSIYNAVADYHANSGTFTDEDWEFAKLNGISNFLMTIENELNNVEYEIREDVTDDGEKVFDVYEQMAGDSEFLEEFSTKREAEDYIRSL